MESKTSSFVEISGCKSKLVKNYCKEHHHIWPFEYIVSFVSVGNNVGVLATRFKMKITITLQGPMFVIFEGPDRVPFITFWNSGLTLTGGSFIFAVQPTFLCLLSEELCLSDATISIRFLDTKMMFFFFVFCDMFSRVLSLYVLETYRRCGIYWGPKTFKPDLPHPYSFGYVSLL